jgi:hypothetical protein
VVVFERRKMESFLSSLLSFVQKRVTHQIQWSVVIKPWILFSQTVEKAYTEMGSAS